LGGVGRQAVIDEVGALIGVLNPIMASDVDLLDELAAVRRLCAIGEAGLSGRGGGSSAASG